MRDSRNFSIAGFLSLLLSAGFASAQGAPVPAPPPQAPAAAPQPLPPGAAPAAPAPVAPTYAPAPPVGYAQPASPAWGGQQPPPNEIRYIEGRPIPPGYHLETRVRKGLVISGPIVFGVPYLLSLSSAAASRYSPDMWLYAPVIGPFADLASRKDECDTTIVTGGTSSTISCNDQSSTRFFLMVDGIMQAAGATMFILGLALPQHLLVRDDAPYTSRSGSQFTLSVAPTTIGRNGYGVGAVGTF